MSKMSIDKLLEKVPNRYVLAIIAGKKYRENLKECTETNVYVSHDKLSNKVINQLGEEDSLEKYDYLNPKEGI